MRQGEVRTSFKVMWTVPEGLTESAAGSPKIKAKVLSHSSSCFSILNCRLYNFKAITHQMKKSLETPEHS